MNNNDTNLTLRDSAMKWVKKNWPEMIGAVMGGTGGFLYYSLIGCSTGTCPIVSNPWSSIAVGAVFGYAIGTAINSQPKKNKKS
jgi:hypothetical protein